MLILSDKLGFRKEKEIMNKDDDDFVCARPASCIYYNMPPEYCCLDVACVLPCPLCMCRRKRTDSLNRTFANCPSEARFR